MDVTASAPGKLIVLGEYAVLDGADGLVWAVDRRVLVHAGVTAEANLVVEAPEVGVDRASADVDDSGVRWHAGLDDESRVRLRMVAGVVAAVRMLGRLPDVHVRIDTSALVSPEVGDKLGVGSSAAVVTALTGALLSLAGIEVTGDAGRRRVFETALAAHSQAQGNLGSGIDVAAGVYGGALRYRRAVSSTRSAPPRQLPLPAELRWHAVWSGRAASTPAMVTMVRAFARDDVTAYRELIGELSAISARGCDAFAAGDVGGFVEAARLYELALARLGAAAGVDIVSVDHQRIGGVVRAEGGVYKPSGAGGGDLGIALSGDLPTHEAVGAALARAGLVTVPVAVDEDGWRLET